MQARLPKAALGLLLEQVIGDAAAQYDASQFHWIGNPAADNHSVIQFHL